MKIKSSGFRHLIEACAYSVSGLKTTFANEAAFRQICLLCAFGAPTAFLVADSWAERILLILPLALAIIVELLNTAIENIVDLVSPDWNELAKRAKDAGSAAQFCAQILVWAVWVAYLVVKFY